VSSSSLPWEPLSEGLALEFDALCRVHDAVEDGVGEGRIVEPLVPCGDGHLAGDQRGAGADAVIEQFEQVAAFGRGDRGDREVIEHQQIDAGELREVSTEAAVAVGDVQGIEQPWGASSFSRLRLLRLSYR